MSKNNFKKEAIFIAFLLVSIALILPSTQAISLFKKTTVENENDDIIIKPLTSNNEARDFSIVIHQLAQEDEIDPGSSVDWNLRMYVNGERKTYSLGHDNVVIDKTFTWDDIVPSGETIVQIRFELKDKDLFFDDIADISARKGGGKDNEDNFNEHRGAVFIRSFNIETNEWMPEDENNDYIMIDDILNVKWYKTSGTFDGSTNEDENDAAVWFNLFYENNPPYTPEKPSGPNEGMINKVCTFQTRCRDPDDDRIQFGWDWNGDGQVDELTDFYDSWQTCTIQHTWREAGIYYVRVMAIDEGGMASELSESLCVEIASSYGKTGAKLEKTWYGLEATIYLDHKQTLDLVDTINKGGTVISTVAAMLTLIFNLAGIELDIRTATAIATAIIKLTASVIRMADTHDKGVYFKVHVVLIGSFPVASAAYVWGQD